MLIRMTHQPVNWNINQTTSRWGHTCGGERDDTVPEDACCGALPLQPKSTPLIKECQLQSVQSRWDWFHSNWSKSHWFRNLDFLNYLINLSIKIINIWFLGFSDLSDGKITQNLEKWVYGFTWWYELENEPLHDWNWFLSPHLLQN